MKMKHRFVLGTAALVIALSLSGCPNPNNPETNYTVTVASLTNGGITAAPAGGLQGTAIILTITPADGYRLKEGSLKYNDGNSNVPITGNSFVLPAANVTVAAEFEIIPADVYIVTIASLTNGSVTAAPNSGSVGTAITLTVTPANGYRLKAGSLQYNDGSSDVLITGTGFVMPAANVTVTAEFEILPPSFNVTIDAPLQNGNLNAAPNGGPQGTAIVLTVTPANGYRLKEGSLQYNDGSSDVLITGTGFVMPAANVTVTAEFEILPAGNYSVTIPALANGSVTATPQYALPGTAITLTVTPANGYRLKEGSLQYNGGGSAVPITGNSFALPAANVTVTAEFEVVNYTVTIASLTNGNVTAAPNGGSVGTAITLTVTPANGYRLKAGSLQYNGGGSDIPITGTSFTLPAANVTVAAEFEVVNYTVTIASLTNGGVTAAPDSGSVGTTITLTVTPADGYRLKEGSLKYNDGGSDMLITGTSFVLPAADVTVAAEFEATVPSGQTVDEGIKALAEGRFDAAIDAFESAYQQNQNDRAAIVYSSLGRLASIARDPTVKNMMQNRLGFTGYPGTIDSLITGDWMESYVDEELVYWYYENDNSYTWFDPNDEWDVPFFNRYGLSLKAGYYYQEYLGETRHTLVHQEKIDGIHSYYDYDFGGWVEWYDDDPGEGDRGAGYYWSTSYTYLLASETARYHTRNERAPGLDLPVWFTETGAYTSNVTSAGTLQASAWPLLLFANLVDKNQDGLNSLLDALLSSVFGSSFEDAAGRFSNLAYNQFIEVDRDIIDAFGLSELLEGDDLYIGKAELDLLFSAVRLFKASLEWVAAYDWNTDISFLKTDWQTIVDRIDTLAPGNLPFGNNFMKDRGKGMMTNSKNDFLKALGDAVGTYDHLAGVDSELPGAYVDALKEYGWVKDGLSKLKNAIQSGGTFYVPERAPSGNSYPNTPVNSALGFDMGKLFTPGQFAIDQLIETESGGRSPQFYAFGADDSPVPISSKAQMDSLNESYYIGFKLKMNRVKEAVLGLDHYEHETTSIPLFPVQIGKDLYGLYHK